jgi:hypothetical protein
MTLQPGCGSGKRRPAGAVVWAQPVFWHADGPRVSRDLSMQQGFSHCRGEPQWVSTRGTKWHKMATNSRTSRICPRAVCGGLTSAVRCAAKGSARRREWIAALVLIRWGLLFVPRATGVMARSGAQFRRRALSAGFYLNYRAICRSDARPAVDISGLLSGPKSYELKNSAKRCDPVCTTHLATRKKCGISARRFTPHRCFGCRAKQKDCATISARKQRVT